MLRITAPKIKHTSKTSIYETIICLERKKGKNNFQKLFYKDEKKDRKKGKNNELRE